LYFFNGREIPRVLQIYDIVHLGKDEVRKNMRTHFYQNANVKDERVIDMLLEKGYMDLEDTLLQYKQRSQLLIIIEGVTPTHHMTKGLKPNSTDEEQFQQWIS
jgi:NADH dehydrogenase (ubiquinone) 1 alpha subcomplex subunit 6